MAVEPFRRRDAAGRRAFLGAALLGATSMSVQGPSGRRTARGSQSSAAGADASQGKLVGLHPQGAPPADAGYSPGILARAGRLVFVSGQGPRDLEADMETQIRQTLERIRAVVASAGGSMADIVMLRSYFVHLARDLPAYRRVRREFLEMPYPASTAVGVTELAIPGLEVEIEAVAVV